MLDLNWSIPTPQRPHPKASGQAVIQARAAAEAEFLEGGEWGRGAYENPWETTMVAKKKCVFVKLRSFFVHLNATVKLNSNSKQKIHTDNLHKYGLIFCWKKSPQFVAPIFCWLVCCTQFLTGRWNDGWHYSSVRVFWLSFLAPLRSRWIPPKKLGTCYKHPIIGGFFYAKICKKNTSDNSWYMNEIEAYMILSIEPNCCEA